MLPKPTTGSREPVCARRAVLDHMAASRRATAPGGPVMTIPKRKPWIVQFRSVILQTPQSPPVLSVQPIGHAQPEPVASIEIVGPDIDRAECRWVTTSCRKHQVPGVEMDDRHRTI
jgi:hypothetical protein